MTIDWITVSAQIVNFLILVWLLKRFLYRPVVNAMTQREQRIAARLAEADQREATADRAEQAHRQAMETLEQDRDALLRRARDTAEAERKRLLETARAEVARQRERWLDEVAGERQRFLDRLRRQSLDAVTLITRQALSDLADEDLEHRLVSVLIRKLEILDDDSRRLMTDTDDPVQVESAFELSEPERRRLAEALTRQLGPQRPVRYRISPELVCGIRLNAGGQRLDWSVAAYLEELNANLESALADITTASRGEA
jgi:F-type H+-transporting ATPase subunit b